MNNANTAVTFKQYQ